MFVIIFGRSNNAAHLPFPPKIKLKPDEPSVLLRMGEQGPQNDFSLPCNILPNKRFQNKKGAILSLPIKLNFSGRNSLQEAIVGTIIVARGALL